MTEMEIDVEMAAVHYRIETQAAAAMEIIRQRWWSAKYKFKIQRTGKDLSDYFRGVTLDNEFKSFYQMERLLGDIDGVDYCEVKERLETWPFYIVMWHLEINLYVHRPFFGIPIYEWEIKNDVATIMKNVRHKGMPYKIILHPYGI